MIGAVQAEANNADAQKCREKDDTIQGMQQQLDTAALELHNLHILKAQEQQDLVKEQKALHEHAHNQHNKVCQRILHSTVSPCLSWPAAANIMLSYAII